MIEVTETRRVNTEGRNARGEWEPGYCPNPNGRKGKDHPSLTNAILARLEAFPQELKELAEATIANAKQGNAVALKQVWDRLDGTVTDRSETLIRQAEADSMTEEAILVAAEAIKRRHGSEKQATTLPVEATSYI